jgi:hypothetical protein
MCCRRAICRCRSNRSTAQGARRPLAAEGRSDDGQGLGQSIDGRADVGGSSGGAARRWGDAAIQREAIRSEVELEDQVPPEHGNPPGKAEIDQTEFPEPGLLHPPAVAEPIAVGLDGVHGHDSEEVNRDN